MIRTVCVDLDGVLNVYEEWRGPDQYDGIRPGAREFLAALHDAEYVETVVFTTRNVDGTWEWLEQNNLDAYVDRVTNEKPPAVIYIDDRGYCFDGNFETALDAAFTFVPFWERQRRERLLQTPGNPRQG